MSYLVDVRLPFGEILHRQAENISDLSYVTDDGERLCVVHDQDDFPFTADMCDSRRTRQCRAWRAACRPLPPTVALTWAWAGRFMHQLAGMRTTTPALSSAGASLRTRAARTSLSKARRSGLGMERVGSSGSIR
jgi:hypothetical protein